MFALLLMALSNLMGETSDALGKSAMARRIESIYAYAFLNAFWSCIFLVLSCVFLGRAFKFSTQSLPIFLPRVVLEVCISTLGARAMSIADLSTMAFLRLITIPLLLFLDIILGYKISASEVLGIMLIFGTLIFLLGHRSLNPRGGRLIVLIGVLAAISITMYKYDISHYNSVAAEQGLIYMILMAYFTAAAWYHGRERTWGYLFRSRTEAQSLASGLSGALNSFAYAYVPASLALTFSRATEILFATLFGNKVFHEKKLGHKIAALGIVVVALIFLGIRA